MQSSIVFVDSLSLHRTQNTRVSEGDLRITIPCGLYDLKKDRKANDEAPYLSSNLCICCDNRRPIVVGRIVCLHVVVSPLLQEPRLVSGR